MRQRVQIGILLMTIMSLFACQGERSYPGMRTPEERALYQRVNDSMAHLRPQALDMIRQQMEQAEDSLTWYDYYLMYGRHYLLTDKPDSLLPYAERTRQFATRQQPQTPRTRGLQAIALSSTAAYLYLMHQEEDRTISLYQEAYILMAQSDAVEGLSDLSANIGDAYVAKNDLAEAAKWYRRALFLSDSLQLPKQQQLTLYMGLGRIYTNLHNFEMARQYYETTDRHFDEMKPNMQSYFLNNYGNYFYYHKEYDKALQMFRRLKVHIKRYDGERNFDMYLCKINLADVFLNLHMPDSAHYYLAEPEVFFKEQHVDVGIYYAQTIRIGIALEEQRLGDVAQIIQESKGLEINDPGMKAIRESYLNRYYAAMGDYQKAYAGLSDNLERNNSEEEELKQMQTAEIMMRLTEDTIRLHHELKLNKQEIKYEKTRTVYILIVAILLAAALGGLAWSFYQRKRYLQTRLKMIQLRMMNTRQRISPHFIFNVLNSHISKMEKKEGEQLVLLAHLLRTNLDLTQKTFVTLSEELDFVERYVELERQMSGMDFDFTIDAPDKQMLEDIKLPSMMVQILTENAILHGLKNKEGEKRLCIKVEDMGTQVRITVSDNGPGFDIRSDYGERTRTGLNIIRSTVSTLNMENGKTKIRFDIKNENGCHASLTISKDIKYPQNSIKP